MLIDDTAGNLKTGQMIFSKLKYNIDTLSDGIFIDYDNINKYDIILLDIIMSHSTGLEICSKIINKNYSGIILATTGHVTESDINLYKKQGFNGVLGKPFQFTQSDAFFKKILVTKEWDVLV